MNLMKRLGLAALLVTGVTLIVSAPANGGGHGGLQKPGVGGSIDLWNTDVEPDASGKASLTNVKSLNDPRMPILGWETYSGKLTVTCHNLTPGVTYWTCVGTFTANGRGEGKASGNVQFTVDWQWGPYMYMWVEVVRVDTGTTVLEGFF